MEEKGGASNGTHQQYFDEEQEEEMLAQEFESLVLQSNAYENDNHSSMIMIENRVDFGDEDEGNLQAYPLRPYAEDCSFFVKTGSCKFGHACRFNHPSSYGGFQDQEKGSEMNNGTIADTSKIDCKYFRSPGGCRYGDACRYKHSVPKLDNRSPELNFLGLPVRPSEQECAFYLRTGSCGYGANCRFHHPDPTAVKETESQNSMTNVRGGNSYPKMYANEPFQSSGVSRGILETNVRGGNNYPKMYANEPFQSSGVSQSISDLSNGINLMNGLPYVAMNYYQAMPQNTSWSQDQVNLPLSAKKTPLPHQIFNNSKKKDLSTHYEQVMQSEEFPLRPGQPYCDYFMKHGDCKYRAACRYNHPVSRTSKLHLPQLSSKDAHPKYKSHDLASSNPGNTRKNGAPSYQQPQNLNGTYPERPGQPECEFFMKTGNCKFKAACKYHHPKDRMSTPSSCALNEAGFPLRPDARICRNYEQLGTCKYGQTCLFHHPDNFSLEITDQVARDASEDEGHSSSNAVGPIALESSSNNMGSDWGDGWVI